MPPISVMMKPASGLCNMSCDYCFYCDESSKRETKYYGFMSEQTLKNVIRKTMLKAERSISYAYQGGEPTLRGLEFFEAAVAFQRQFNKRGIRVNNSLQTNGYAIDENWCHFFKENNFLVGISVDGTQQIHNTYRHSRDGGPTYECIMRTIELFDRYGIEYNILTVVNQKIATNIGDVYKTYQKNGWNYQQYIACLDPLGEQHGVNKYSLKPEQYGKFLIELFELWFADWKLGKQPYIRQFENYIGILLGYHPEACDQRGTCGIQNVVEADGSVYPCDFYMLDSYCLGNFNQNQLEDIDRARRKIAFIEESKKISDTCKACRYYNLCRGGCQRNRDFSITSGVYENYFCKGYQMFFEECLDKMQEIVSELHKYTSNK